MNEIEQNTPAWYEARAGHITASRISAVMAKPRKGQKESVTRKEYMAQLIFERLAGKSLEEERGNFYDIKRGNELQSAARCEYEMRNGVVVDTAGFVKHPKLAWAGCSPDGLIGINGLVQLKAPRRHVQLDWWTHKVVPPEHRDQMLFELACHPERDYNDFASFVDDDVPMLRLFQVRLHRDAVRIAEIEAAVAKCNAEIEETFAKLAGKELSLEDQLRSSLAAVTEQEEARAGLVG